MNLTLKETSCEIGRLACKLACKFLVSLVKAWSLSLLFC